MLTIRQVLIVGVLVPVLGLCAIAQVVALPGTVPLVSGPCAGQGSSQLNYPGGEAKTLGCSASSRYLSTSMAFSGGSVQSHPGAWYPFNPVIIATGTSSLGTVTTVVSTHNMQYLTSPPNGWVNTNTWPW